MRSLFFGRGVADINQIASYFQGSDLQDLEHLLLCYDSPCAEDWWECISLISFLHLRCLTVKLKMPSVALAEHVKSLQCLEQLTWIAARSDEDVMEWMVDHLRWHSCLSRSVLRGLRVFRTDVGLIDEYSLDVDAFECLSDHPALEVMHFAGHGAEEAPRVMQMIATMKKLQSVPLSLDLQSKEEVRSISLGDVCIPYSQWVCMMDALKMVHPEWIWSCVI